MAVKEIILKIKGNDGIEFTTEGRLFSRGSTTLIQYEETELSGFDGYTTSLTITPGRIRMKRSGGSANGGTEMVFEKGRRVRGLYATPLGNIDMEIVTDDISGSLPLTGQPGKILIDYSISLKGLFDGRKKLEIQILDKGTLADYTAEETAAPETEGSFSLEKMLKELSRFAADGGFRQDGQPDVFPKVQ